MCSFQPETALHLCVQGCLAHKKQRSPRTLQQDYAYGPMVVLKGGAVSYERSSQVGCSINVQFST